MLTCITGQQTVFPAGLLSCQLQKPTGRLYFLVNSTASQALRILKALVYDPTEPWWRQSVFVSCIGEHSPWCWNPGETNDRTDLQVQRWELHECKTYFNCSATPGTLCSWTGKKKIFNFSSCKQLQFQKQVQSKLLWQILSWKICFKYKHQKSLFFPKQNILVNLNLVLKSTF